ncbi:MAG: class I SAM-dependent methyltransferase, partial [Bacteroidales bacterium]
EFVKPYLKPDFSICDIGCKYGLISAMLAQQVKKVVAVDSDPNAISIAQKLYHGNNLQFICSEGTEYLKSNSGKFDMIVLSHILEHIDNPVEFLQKNIPCTNLIFIEVPDIEKSFLNQYRLDTGSSLTYSDQDHIFEFDRVYLMNLFGELHLEIANSEYKYGVQRYLLKTNTH